MRFRDGMRLFGTAGTGETPGWIRNAALWLLGDFPASTLPWGTELRSPGKGRKPKFPSPKEEETSASPQSGSRLQERGTPDGFDLAGPTQAA